MDTTLNAGFTPPSGQKRHQKSFGEEWPSNQSFMCRFRLPGHALHVCVSRKKIGRLGSPSFRVLAQQGLEVPNTETENRIVVVTSGKGGVGKTTTTANLGMSIARLGYRVALIDADIGLRNLDLLLGLENRVLYTAMDIVEGQCRLDQALIRDKR